MGDAERDEGTLSDNPESAAAARSSSRPELLQAGMSNDAQSATEPQAVTAEDQQNSGGLDLAVTERDAAPAPLAPEHQAPPQLQSTHEVLGGAPPAAESYDFAEAHDATGPVGHEDTKPFGIVLSEQVETATEDARLDTDLSATSNDARLDTDLSATSNDAMPNVETTPQASATDEILPPDVAAAAVAAVTMESAAELLRYRHTAVTPKADGFSGFERESQPTVPGRSLRSKPPPKPANYRSEPPPVVSEVPAPEATAVGSELAEKIHARMPSSGGLGHHAPSPSQADAEDLASPELSAAVNSIAPVEAVPRRDASGPNQGRKSKLPMVFWGLSLVVVFMMGLAFGSPSPDVAVKVEAEQKARVAAARAEAFAEGKAHREPTLPVFDLSVPKGAKDPEVASKVPPPARTRLDAMALGRYWSQQRFDAITGLTEQLKRQPQALADEKLRAEVLKSVSDRATSRIMLETLAELGTVPALDILYDVWIGSKDRNEVTQLAEALLLASDVRPHASKALELALLLREKPTDCGVVTQLVETAIREGDRRSAMQLVNLGARVNCGASGDQDCIKCLADPKDLRKAVHASVSRPAPL